MINRIKKLLISKYFQPTLSLIACIEAVIIAVVGWNIPKDYQNNANLQYIFIIVLLCLVVITLLTVAIVGIRKNAKRSIITRLCELQNTYLNSPNFVTAQEHTDASREKDLGEGGTAKILTNGLVYDISSSSDIALNIINGAKYIYILPNTPTVIRELERYIELLAHKLGDRIQSEKLLSNNIEFWFFDKSITCLYNFATLKQISREESHTFDQAWWYINPKDNTPSSYMLTKEIESTHDRDLLSDVFADLEKYSLKYSGNKIFEKRECLQDLIGR